MSVRPALSLALALLAALLFSSGCTSTGQEEAVSQPIPQGEAAATSPNAVAARSTDAVARHWQEAMEQRAPEEAGRERAAGGLTSRQLVIEEWMRQIRARSSGHPKAEITP